MHINAFTDEERAKLAGIAAEAQKNVQSDWDATSGDALILNKPDISALKYGAGYFATKETTIGTGGDWYKVDVAFTPTKEQDIEWDGANNRWEYTGNGTGTSASVTLSFTGSQNETGKKDCGWRVVVNGNFANNPYPDKLVGIDKSLPASVTMLVPDVQLNNGDYIELYTTHENNGKKVTTSNCSIMIR